MVLLSGCIRGQRIDVAALLIRHDSGALNIMCKRRTFFHTHAIALS